MIGGVITESMLVDCARILAGSSWLLRGGVRCRLWAGRPNPWCGVSPRLGRW